MKVFYLFISVVLLAATGADGQSLPVGFPLAEEILRRKQVEGEVDSTLTFSMRPFSPDVQYVVYEKDSIRLYHPLFERKRIKLRLLPAQVNVEYNTHHPFGWNNGAMIRSRGLQSLVSIGAYVRIGPLQIQVRPEYAFAENKGYESFPESHPQTLWDRRAIRFWNQVDYPEYFGDGSYTAFSWGQSYAKLTFGPVDIGISNENLWWGPGRFQSLIMTNNAAGFKHLTIKTNRSVKTVIGNIQAHLLVGRLDPSGFAPSSPADQGLLRRFEKNKADDWRYLSAINISLKPRGVENLEVGFIRSLQQYFQTAKANGEYLPVVLPLSRQGVGGADDMDQQASLYSRLLLPEAQAEIYVEIGRNDSPWNMRDFLMAPEHSLAYVIGFSKIIEAEHFSLQPTIEVFKSQRSGSYLIRPEPQWYRNGRIKHGYAHRGEVVGSGLMPGSNSIHFRLVGYKGLNSVGFSFDRILNDQDYFYQDVQQHAEHAKPWADYAFGLNHNRKMNNFLLSASCTFVRSLNYQWQYELVRENPVSYKGAKRSNVFISLKSAYTF